MNKVGKAKAGKPPRALHADGPADAGLEGLHSICVYIVYSTNYTKVLANRLTYTTNCIFRPLSLSLILMIDDVVRYLLIINSL